MTAEAAVAAAFASRRSRRGAGSTSAAGAETVSRSVRVRIESRLAALARERETQPGSVRDHDRMDVVELLESACLLVPEEAATENDISVQDVWDHLAHDELAHDEWQTALNLLEEPGDGQPLPLTLWEQLAEAAGRLGFERSAAWCHWRCSEIRNGMTPPAPAFTLRGGGAGKAVRSCRGPVSPRSPGSVP